LPNSSKKFSVEVTEVFASDLKKLKKSYPRIGDDLLKLNKKLELDPISGNDQLGRCCYKVRMQISDKNKGKRGGARIIIHVKIENKKVSLLSIYDKSKKSDLFEGELDRLINKLH
jgi:mRNA-degrading endonuclease RelE of RelBE toxin-antitoxin system